MSEPLSESLSWSWKKIGGYTFTAITTVGTLLAIYQFFADRSITSFAYSIPEPFKVYDSSAPSGISVLDSAGNLIKDDVYLQEIIIWNNGNQPIEPDEVRVPITLKLVAASLSDKPPAPGQPRILEFKVANETSPSISMVKVRKKNAASNSEIVVSWKHFDKGQAANIQVIYATPHSVPPTVLVNGQIVGISRLTDADTPTIARVAPWIPRWTFFPALLLISTSMAFLLQWVNAKDTTLRFLFGFLLLLAILSCLLIFIFSP